MPAWPASGSVFAKTVYRFATPAFVMKRFEPSRTYSSPSRRAVVRIAALSEPEPDSVSAYAGNHSPLANFGRYFAFCSSVPASLSPSEPSSCTARMSADVPQTFPTSSIAMSERSAPVPSPPYCSSKKRPKMSFSRKSSTTSHGNSCESVDLRRARRDPLARDLADEIAQLPLLVGQDVPGHAAILRRGLVLSR